MENGKKLFLIFHGRFPSEKAAAVFTAKNCEAFSNIGYEVTLLVPRRFGRIAANPHEYYKLKKDFRVVYLPTIDLFLIPIAKAIAFRISLVVFSISCFLFLIFRAKKDNIIYSNETLPILLASYIFPCTLYEMHDFPEQNFWFYRKLFKRTKYILVHNKWKLKRLHELFPEATSKSFYEPNAVDLQEFDIELSMEDARKKLGIPTENRVVVYTGHLYSWKGVDTLANAAEELADEILVYFVGGTKKDREKFKTQFAHVKNVRIVGHRPHTEVPIWQKAADVLVLPNTAKKDISRYYTSPMKLFEYMASRRPIVASRIPSVEEIVDGNSVYFAQPDDPHSFVEKIQEVLTGKTIFDHVESSFQQVKKYTWELRARRIIRFIESK